MSERRPHPDDLPVIGDMMLGIVAATLSGLLVGCMIGASLVWLSTSGGN